MDNFALLGQPRRPWLDSDALKAAFLERSAAEHPDRVHAEGAAARENATARYAELNAAHQCLREPKDRLAHLLELELGAAPASVQAIPPAAMDLFARVGQTCREADRVLAARAAATSPLVQAQWFSQGLELASQLMELQRQIHLQRDALLAELRAMNDDWNCAPAPGSPGRAQALPLRRLEEIYRVFSYTGRWSAQVQERLGHLST